MNAILPPLKNKSPKAREHSGENSPLPRHLEGLAQTILNIEKLVPPLWPLGDYVAVNPFLGYADLNLLETQKELSMSRDCRIFMDKGYFRSMLDAG
ncbi:MAG: putative inorganic carbon transporter subunit DabA, partial [Gemmataceae bacterium]